MDKKPRIKVGRSKDTVRLRDAKTGRFVPTDFETFARNAVYREYRKMLRKAGLI